MLVTTAVVHIPQEYVHSLQVSQNTKLKQTKYIIMTKNLRIKIIKIINISTDIVNS
jgi:hypothetical protein